MSMEKLPAIDLYFENGMVYTVDNKSTVAQALAVKDGKIVFVGSAEEGRPYKEAAAKIVDLGGKMLLPGFVDTHIHIASAELFDFSVFNILSIDETLDIVEQYVKAHPKQDSYTGFGYMTGLFTGEEQLKGPRKERLDKICPDKPMFIFAYDGHSTWINSKCFELMNVTKDTVSPPGGEIVLDDDTGELWGTVKDAAMALLPEIHTPEEKLSSFLKGYQARLNALGYTSIFVPAGNGFMPVPWEGLTKLEKEGGLTLRVRGSNIITTWKAEEDIQGIREMKDQYNSDLVKLTTAKFFIDGGLANQSALLLEPYIVSDSCGPVAWPQEKLNEVVSTINQMGVQIHFHTWADGAVRAVLDATEHAQKQGASKECRNTMAHLQIVHPSDFARFAELNIIASVQPYWHLKAPMFWGPMERDMVGDERAEKFYPLKTFLDNDIHTAFGSDYPVTGYPNPFYAIQGAVTRNLFDGAELNMPDITDMDEPECLLWPEERIGMKEALHSFTAEGAYAIFEEDTIGTLEVGKLADLIVVDRNLFEVEPLDIKNTKVLQTYLQGKQVFGD